MEQVKIFNAATASSAGIEQDINNWLEKNDGEIYITRVLQIIDSSNSLIITIFYKAKDT